jgi:hypothetical protein
MLRRLVVYTGLYWSIFKLYKHTVELRYNQVRESNTRYSVSVAIYTIFPLHVGKIKAVIEKAVKKQLVTQTKQLSNKCA